MSKKTVFKYKGYEGSKEISDDDDCLVGKVLAIRDTIFYDAETVGELKAAFEQAVDQYLSDCEDIGREPNKPFAGTFNIRVGEDKHRQLTSLAFRRDTSINALVREAVEDLLKKDRTETTEVHHHHHATIETHGIKPQEANWSVKKAKLSLVAK